MKKLAILGASYLQIPLVNKAKEMGLETHCFAWSEGAVCKDIVDYFYPISILDQEKIFEICEKLKIDGITTIATDIAVPTICYVAEKLHLNSNSYQSALMSTNKRLMRDAFELAGCNSPKFIVLEKEDNIFIKLDFPVIVKPVDRSGSRGVYKIEKQTDLGNAVKNAIEESLSNQAIVEEFIDGQEVSVESISWKGKHYVLAITDKVTTESPNFVELAHHQPSILSDLIQSKIRQQTILALNALKIQNGASHSEFKINNNGEVFVIEVGARMGGDFIGSHLVELSTGYDFVKAVVNAALNQFVEPIMKENLYSGVYFLCDQTKDLLPYFQKKNDFEVEKEVQNFELKKITNSNDRSGYLIYQSTKKIELL